ncbi:MAG TPA: hypothetical protein VNK26_01810 [Pyrinomonadaceae bacterium]|nr:hypothetical protein [Pyrinomonadaceae bacterium]
MGIKQSARFKQRQSGENLWWENGSEAFVPNNRPLPYKVLNSEEEVGRALFQELTDYAETKSGDINIVLLGGRGAQAMYKIIRGLAEANEIDDLLGRLNVFTQDALAPLGMRNSLNFVKDFERQLGEAFFRKIKKFVPMITDSGNLESSVLGYLESLERLGGIDIFYIGLGPEENAASHICYIKPNSGARYNDLAGLIPISESILEHHIAKFKAGGSEVSPEDEAECRRAKFIMTLGPAVILSAKRVVQSIVDASTAPRKKESFKRLIETEINQDIEQAERQCNENPGLWIRLHNNVQSYVLPDLLS